ncbi:hypothetical protein [Streptomyces finlayi]|uniref:hypothetical protein n=1 Tax=Streptomyces finlayi TaxID=67296 RepID=UPI0016262211|nr:hypothetical protein [Streptomyces finlayi]
MFCAPGEKAVDLALSHVRSGPGGRRRGGKRRTELLGTACGRSSRKKERIYEEFGIDTHRASALVLIGHPMSQPEVTEKEINDALRIHTSHLNRIEVLTCQELIDSAERALEMG